MKVARQQSKAPRRRSEASTPESLSSIAPVCYYEEHGGNDGVLRLLVGGRDGRVGTPRRPSPGVTNEPAGQAGTRETPRARAGAQGAFADPPPPRARSTRRTGAARRRPGRRRRRRLELVLAHGPEGDAAVGGDGEEVEVLGQVLLLPAHLPRPALAGEHEREGAGRIAGGTSPGQR